MNEGEPSILFAIRGQIEGKCIDVDVVLVSLRKRVCCP
jgi:hypothetical protein